MTNLTNAERLILAFESSHPSTSLSLHELAVFAESLGGNGDAVRMSIGRDASVCAYIAALTIRHIECINGAFEREDRSNNRELSMPNTGHGHVYPRADGAVARCGGPGFCKECNVDNAIKSNSQPASDGL